MPDPAIYAWRCEECREWHAKASVVHEVYVMEPGPEALVDGVLYRVPVVRRLLVCDNCRAVIGGQVSGYRAPSTTRS